MDSVTMMFDSMGQLLKVLKDHAVGEYPVSKGDTLGLIHTHAHKIAELAKTELLMEERRG